MYKWVDEKGVTHYSNAPHELPNAGVEETGEAKSKKPVEKDKPQDDKKFKDNTTKSKSKALSNKPTPKPKFKPKAKYKFEHWSIRQQGKNISVSSRISGGEACNNLKVTVFFKNEKGSKRHVECNVNVGSYGSRIVSGNTTSYSDGRNWNVTKVYTECLD